MQKRGSIRELIEVKSSCRDGLKAYENSNPALIKNGGTIVTDIVVTSPTPPIQKGRAVRGLPFVMQE